ncbi:MAG: hypothetical protein AAFU60_02275 [Bacteroidota bacterium]
MLILASCREAPTTSFAEEKVEILANTQLFSKEYYGVDSTRLASVYKDTNSFVLRLHFPRSRYYAHYAADLESFRRAAQRDGLFLDSLDRISMNFFGNHPALLEAFSNIPGVQKELMARDQESRRFLDHDQLGQALQASEELATFLSLLGIPSTSNTKVILEKCRSERIDSQNADPQGRHFDLHCAHLLIALR